MADALNTPAEQWMCKDEFVLHQMLHGYADGHRLLASSLTLSGESARTVLRLSDLSGPNLVRGFEDYLTAYPLPGHAAFAFAKTWSAPEMSRPGCVWTHTLILSEEIVADLQSLADLVHLFARPSDGFFGGYNSKLSWRPMALPFDPTKSVAMLTRESEVVIWKLYGTQCEPIVIEAKDSREWEELFLAIWALGWPSLRMKMSFCTGSLSARSTGRGFFDIQAAPSSVVREISREIAIIRISGTSSSNTTEFPSWVHVAARELRPNSLLADFFRTVTGPDDDRRHFAPLTRLYVLLVSHDKEVNALPQLLAATAELFPLPTDGVNFKTAVFGPAPLRKLTAHISERVLLEELAVTPHHLALNVSGLHPRERGRTLWHNAPIEARSLLLKLFRVPLNPLGEEILRGLVFGLRPDDALELAKSAPDLLTAALRIHPSLAAYPQVWHVGESRQRSMFAAVASAEDPISHEQSAGIIGAILDAGASVLASPVLRTYGEAAVGRVLAWVDAEGKIPQGWEHALARYPIGILDWLSSRHQVSARTAIELSTLLDPTSAEVIRHGSSIWLSAITTLKNLPTDPVTLRFYAFNLALALENSSPNPEQLAAITFADVHAALSDSRMEYDWWSMLERRLPEVSWSIWWDKCERLRRGLIEAFVRFGWPSRELLSCARSPALLRAVKKSARKVSGGRELLVNLISEQRRPGGSSI